MQLYKLIRMDIDDLNDQQPPNLTAQASINAGIYISTILRSNASIGSRVYSRIDLNHHEIEMRRFMRKIIEVSA